MSFNFNSMLRSQNTQDAEEQKKQTRIYSTAVIQAILDDYNKGYEIDNTPFFEGDINYKAPNIMFRMTNEEVDEFEKCMLDANYFVEKYCLFLTDYGRSNVKLRDYQKDIIESVTTDEYDPKLDLYIPKNRYVIIMASRQIGKTASGETKISFKTTNWFKKKLIALFEWLLKNYEVKK